ncbi:DUF3304 domain-containing protein [Xanthomonas oryzae]|uniref:DUF3304 domain-containing protein n=1 Tax=Xanthomonas oryzae TaxID=347 RepID=UPI00103493FC|nr:DUF3304 domain-containing protein [Xanthomonas oryzae]QBH04581.1 DUF3304 domain-containing protein [Xanthomonas oryzae]
MMMFPCRLERLQVVFHVLALVGLVALLLGCSSDQAQSENDGMFSSTVDPMDNDPSDTFVRNVYIDGRWTGDARSGGSGVVDGIRLPVKWHPGLTAHVRWERCERFDSKHPIPDSKACRWHELDAPVTRYTQVGMTHLHIMPGDKQVLIIPSMLAPNHPDYPGPGFPTKDFFARFRDPKDKDEVRKEGKP